jgi:hypothetical protein
MSTEVKEEEIRDNTETPEETTDNTVEPQAMAPEAVMDLSDEDVEKLAKGEPLTSEEKTEDEGAETQEQESAADTTSTDEGEKPEGSSEKTEKPEGDGQDEEQISVSKAEWEKQQAHAKTQAEFDQRRNTEVGNLRAENAKLKAEKATYLASQPDLTQEQKDKVNDMANAGDIVGAQAEMERIRQENQSRQREAVTAQQQAVIQSQQGFLDSAVPDHKDKAETVRAYMADNGLFTADGAQAFSENPAAFDQGHLIFIMANKAAEADSGKAALEAKVKELEDKLVSVQKNISQHTKKTPTLGNVGSKGGDKEEDTSGVKPEDFMGMSDEELAKHLPKKK